MSFCTFLVVETDSVVEFNITEKNKSEIESDDEQKGCSKSLVPPTPKKKQSSCEFKLKDIFFYFTFAAYQSGR